MEDYKSFPLWAKIYLYPLYVLGKISCNEKLGWHWIIIVLAPHWVALSPMLLIPFLQEDKQ